MTSPDAPSVLTNPITSSPLPIGSSSERSHSHSPVRLRRSNSDPHQDVDPSVSHSRPRLSPTLTRGYNPNDPEVRERQRAMDADMAMHLSRARSNTVTSPPTSPVAPVPHTLSNSESPVNFPVLSLQEEQDVHDARGRPHINSDPDNAEHYHPGPAPDAHLNHLSAAHDPTLLVSLETAETEAGLPMYQASV
ncbi:hypothetical protein DAEQUDRAFT_666025, partial [Daedalea quercina L-15889]